MQELNFVCSICKKMLFSLQLPVTSTVADKKGLKDNAVAFTVDVHPCLIPWNGEHNFSGPTNTVTVDVCENCAEERATAILSSKGEEITSSMMDNFNLLKSRITGIINKAQKMADLCSKDRRELHERFSLFADKFNRSQRSILDLENYLNIQSQDAFFRGFEKEMKELLESITNE